MPVVPADSYNPATIVGAQAPQRVPPPIMASYMYMVPMPMMPVPVAVSPVNPNIHLLTILQNMYQVFPGNVAVIKQLRRAE